MKARGRKVLTDGVFDLLHVNHIRFLEEARKLGDWLVVGVISDASAQDYKRQPVIQEKERLGCVEALSCVDEAFLLDGPMSPATMEKLLAEHDPSVIVHAGGATPEFYVPAEKAGIMHHFGYRSGVNSTEIIARILSRYGNGEL